MNRGELLAYKSFIRDKQDSITSSDYLSYNEFEALNRGQYRTIFKMYSEKNSNNAFRQKIVEPVVNSWDPQSIDALFKNFGDFNIERGHDKTIGFPELKKNFKDYYRLGNRFIAAMSTALKNLVLEGDLKKSELDQDEINLIFETADNQFNAPKFDLFDLEKLTISYSKNYPAIVNMIRTIIADSKAVQHSPYGGVFYLRSVRT